MRTKHLKIILIIFTLAALLYNSWPLGYILNYKTARYGLASDLDGFHQPYYWIFILGDVLVGLSLLAVAVLMRFKLHHQIKSRTLALTLVGLLVFGLFTATSAASPPGCPTPWHVHVCAAIGTRLLGPDGIESSLAALGLFISLISVNILSWRLKLSPLLRRLAQFTLVAWPISVAAFLIAADKNINVHITQQILLILSGLALLVIGLNVNDAIEKHALEAIR